MDYYMKLYAPDLKNSLYYDQFSGLSKKHSNSTSVLRQYGLNVVNSVKPNKNFNIDFTYVNGNQKFHSPGRSLNMKGTSPYMQSYLNNYASFNKNFSQSLERNKYPPVALENRETTSENYLAIEDSMVYNYFTFISLWIDLESTANKLTLSNLATRFLKEFSSYFVINQGRSSIFTNEEINSVFKKFFKLSIIILMFLKICAAEFVYFDNVVKTHLKKNISLLNEIICLIFDLFVISHSRESFFYRKDLIEKIEKYAKSGINANVYRRYGKVQLENALSNINSKYNHLQLNLRSFSNSFYNTTTYIYFHNASINLIHDIDKYSLDQLGEIVINHILYAYMNFDTEVFLKDFPNNVSNNPPFLPQARNEDRKYTLVLDLDETLIHYFLTPSGGYFFVRPGCHQFLKELEEKYEIIIFTAGTKEYADKILNVLDKEKTISYRLYRNHTTYVDDHSLKDLHSLGRDLNRTIFIDNIFDNFRNLPSNGFACKTWTDDFTDKQLLDLKYILMHIADNNIEDVTEIISKIHEQADTTYKEYTNPYPLIDLNSL